MLGLLLAWSSDTIITKTQHTRLTYLRVTIHQPLYNTRQGNEMNFYHLPQSQVKTIINFVH